jgi:hypothetical protein
MAGQGQENRLKSNSFQMEQAHLGHKGLLRQRYVEFELRQNGALRSTRWQDNRRFQRQLIITTVSGILNHPIWRQKLSQIPCCVERIASKALAVAAVGFW